MYLQHPSKSLRFGICGSLLLYRVRQTSTKSHTLKHNPHPGRKPTRRKKAQLPEGKFTSWNTARNVCCPRSAIYLVTLSDTGLGVKRARKITRAGIISAVTILLKTVDLHKFQNISSISIKMTVLRSAPQYAP